MVTAVARYKLKDIFCQAWLSHAITAVVRQGIPDAIGEAPATAADIAKARNLDEPTVYRVLRALAANGIFDEVSPGKFAHNDVSRLLLNKQNSWRGLALMWNHPSCLQAWGNFGEVLKDGRSGIEHAFGRTLYEHLGEDPAATMAFSDAMISNSILVSRSIAREFPFADHKSVLDLAGGVGTLLLSIIDEQPHLKGAVYEIRDLAEAAKETLGDRAEVIVGNFLESVPEGFDLYLVKNSLWNWDDDNCLAILKNIRSAIGHQHEKRFAIIEYIIDDENAEWSTLYDLQILNMPGGRARTIEEYTELLTESEFAVERILRVEDQTIVIAKPA
jgi:hypothetical protein